MAGRRATAALVVALAMMAVERARASDEPIAVTDQHEATIVLHLVTYASLSREVLDEARARVSNVYDVIGVRIVWVEGNGTVKGQEGLGDIIAHEVGHLVLRTNSHSRNGIMRAHVGVHAIHLQSFDERRLGVTAKGGQKLVLQRRVPS